jgi:hypothetical protein
VNNETSPKRPKAWMTFLAWLVAWIVLACAWGGIPPSWKDLAEALPLVAVVIFVAAARKELQDLAGRNVHK